MKVFDRLAKAALLMDKALIDATSLKDSARKIVIYWTLATHLLPRLTIFPIIMLLGKMGTGKSQALYVIGSFSRHPVRLSLRGMTTPAIRDKLVEAYNGTAIIEEADSAWPVTVLKACEESEYSDEAIEEFRRTVLEGADQ